MFVLVQVFTAYSLLLCILQLSSGLNYVFYYSNTSESRFLFYVSKIGNRQTFCPLSDALCCLLTLVLCHLQSSTGASDKSWSLLKAEERQKRANEIISSVSNHHCCLDQPDVFPFKDKCLKMTHLDPFDSNEDAKIVTGAVFNKHLTTSQSRMNFSTYSFFSITHVKPGFFIQTNMHSLSFFIGPAEYVRLPVCQHFIQRTDCTTSLEKVYGYLFSIFFFCKLYQLQESRAL